MNSERLENLLDTFRQQAKELEDTVNRIKAEADHQSPQAKRQKLAIIKTVVADFFSLPESIYASEIRLSQHVEMRHVALYLSRELTRFNLNAIGASFREGMDHGTVIHATRSIVNRIETDHEFSGIVTTLRNTCVEQFDTVDLPLFHITP